MSEVRKESTRESSPTRVPEGSTDAVVSGRALHPGWTTVEGRWLERSFRFDDFAAALAFVNQIGEVAEALQHHPDLELGWGRVRVSLTTHDTGGLTDLDYSVALGIDQIV